MAHPFDDCRLKIERAKQQIGDLERIWTEFIKTNPYRADVHIDHKTREYFATFHIQREFPPLFNIVAGEGLQSMRSALDYGVSALAPATLSGEERRKIAFPIHRMSRTEYEAMRPAKVKGLPPDAIKYIDGLKPYKGGNDALWRLSELNNRDKHRLLLTATMAFDQARVDAKTFVEPEVIKYMQEIALRQRGFRAVVVLQPLDIDRFGPKQIGIKPGNRVFPLHDGAEFFRVKALTDGPLEKRDDFKFAFQIAFNEPEIAEGEPVIPFLHQTLGLVTRITEALARFA